MFETACVSSQVKKRFEARLTDRDFDRFRKFIHETCGIALTLQKRVMLEARLRKRLGALGLYSFEDYADLVFKADAPTEEVVNLINAVTTNKTDFFREPAHFDYLTRHALPYLIEKFGVGAGRPLRIWSAACSTGKEPYTLAMVLKEYQAVHPGFRFDILGTDISTEVLATAALGIYPTSKSEPIPAELKRKYLLKAKDRQQDTFRISPDLRALVRYRWLNLMADDYGLSVPFDVIFCRNVLIYFDGPTQKLLLTKLLRNMSTGGYLFLGHSETVMGMNLPLEQMAPSVYRRI